mmetsp:Transcript_29770/g.45029  ORF Transcript_29770/g.45029 Transcript_29770/m.45029 type:complete len:84 (+) Transcript_29770:819-1070(+)
MHESIDVYGEWLKTMHLFYSLDGKMMWVMGVMCVIASSFHGENSSHRPTNPQLLLSRRSSSIILRPPPFTCRRERWKAGSGVY